MNDQKNLSSGDKEIKCRNCPATFIFTKGEQEFYATRQLSAPVRCKACRDARKVQNASSGGSPYSVPPPYERNFPPPPSNQGAPSKKSAKNVGYGSDVEVVRKRRPEKSEKRRRGWNDED